MKATVEAAPPEAATKDPLVLSRLKEMKDNIILISDAEAASVMRGLKDLEQGKTVSHAQVKQRYEKWL